VVGTPPQSVMDMLALDGFATFLMVTVLVGMALVVIYSIEYIKRVGDHRSEYYDALLRVRTDGDWQSWLLFFLTGVRETAVRATTQAREIMRIREEYRQKVAGRPKALALVDEVLRAPYMTVAEAQRLLKVTNPTARAAVQTLVDAGLLEEVGGRKWRRLYVARPVMDALRSPMEAL